MTRVLLAFTGSRGDAQPGVLLARELRARGHEVTLAVSPDLVDFATAAGVPVVPAGTAGTALLAAQRADRRFSSRSPRQRWHALVDLQRRGVPELVRDLSAAAAGHDLVVTGMACEEAAAAAAHHGGVASVALHFFPVLPNGAVPVVPTASAAAAPGFVHRWGWRALSALRARALAPVLPAGHRPGTARGTVQAYDPGLFPGLTREIPGPFTGFPVDADGILSPARHSSRPGQGRGAVPADHPASGAGADLEAWLAAGPAPVYVGFGSMTVGDPAAVAALVRAVCARRGARLLLAAGWAGGQTGIADDVAVVSEVDHTAVLPRCVVAVHHGGAGTTAAALRAGVPQLICSVQADQPYWGRALARLGLGETLPARALTGARLDAALTRLTTPEAALRAASYAARFAADGIARSADAVESFAAAARSVPERSPS
ncbi:glycosyltransferase [Nocardia thailandica]